MVSTSPSVSPASPPPSFLQGSAWRRFRRFQHDRLRLLMEVGALGPLVRLDLGVRAVYLTNHPDLVKHVLVDHHRGYDKGTRGFNILRLVFGQGLLTSEGELWKKQRRIIQPAFHRQRIGAFADTMVRLTSEKIQQWSQQPPGQVRDMAADMMQLTLEIVSETMFAADVRDGAAAVGKALDVLLKGAMSRVANPLALPLWIPTPENSRLNGAITTLNRLVGDIIERRRREGPGSGDLLDMLMAARDEETGQGMDDHQLRDEVMTIFLAGHETTANLMAWALYLVARHPEVRTRLEQEVDAVLGGRPATMADVPQLVYTDRVLKETLRLYPPAWLVARRAVADDVMGNDAVGRFAIPQGSIVFVCPFVMQRNPQFWPDPDHFDPDRFLEGEDGKGFPKYAWFPFGGGPRLCIGNNFAMMEASLLLSTLVQSLRWEQPEAREVGMEPLVTLRPKGGMPMRIQRRS